jgi:DNA-binding NarL/FixJ family response regulator
MPDMSGIEVLAELRGLEPNIRVAVLGAKGAHLPYCPARRIDMCTSH